ncbi:MAG: hypothetical protein QW175_03965, partial [Candidatus Bathyarchaeia archaeon]
DSTYKNLYSLEENLKSVHLLGCPIASAIACALAKVSGKMVMILRDNMSADGKTLEVWYRLMEG